MRNRRQPIQLNTILLQVITRIKQLHSLGSANRDYKHEKIVLNLEPLDASVIDFDRVSLRSSTTISGEIGNPGYNLNSTRWNEG
jgi:serine/threonine protein kinase